MNCADLLFDKKASVKEGNEYIYVQKGNQPKNHQDSTVLFGSPILSIRPIHFPFCKVSDWVMLLLPAGVMKSFKCSEISPRGWKAILQKLSTALAWSLEQLYVTS